MKGFLKQQNLPGILGEAQHLPSNKKWHFLAINATRYILKNTFSISVWSRQSGFILFPWRKHLCSVWQKETEHQNVRKSEGKNISRFRNLLEHLQAKVVFRIPKNSASQCDSRTPSRLYFNISAFLCKTKQAGGRGELNQNWPFTGSRGGFVT